MLGYVFAATALDIQTHITGDMQRTAAANIGRGIGKVVLQEGGSAPAQGDCPGQAGKAKNDRFQALRGANAQARHRMH